MLSVPFGHRPIAQIWYFLCAKRFPCDGEIWMREGIDLSTAPIMHAAPGRARAGRPAFALARICPPRRLEKCRKVGDFECSVGPWPVRHRMRAEDVCYGRNSNAPRGTKPWRPARKCERVNAKMSGGDVERCPKSEKRARRAT